MQTKKRFFWVRLWVRRNETNLSLHRSRTVLFRKKEEGRFVGVGTGTSYFFKELIMGCSEQCTETGYKRPLEEGKIYTSFCVVQ